MTTDHTEVRPGSQSPAGHFAAPVVVALLTVASWLALLAWDNEKVVRAGIETGPYKPWQVAATVAALAAIYVCALWRRLDPVRTAIVLSTAFATCMMLSFTVLATPSEDASLWPIGVALTFLGTATGCGLIYVLADSLKWTHSD